MRPPVWPSKTSVPAPVDRPIGELDQLPDNGTQPEHPRHLEHQRHLQPASGYRRDLPDWQIIARIGCARGYSDDCGGYESTDGREDQAILQLRHVIRPAWGPVTTGCAAGCCSGRARRKPPPTAARSGYVNDGGNRINRGPFVEIRPDDAARLGVAEDDSVEIASHREHAVLSAVITYRVNPGNCSAPVHRNDAFAEPLSINVVTHDAVDPVSHQPEFNACAVSLPGVAVARADPGSGAAPLDAVGVPVSLTRDTDLAQPGWMRPPPAPRKAARGPPDGLSMRHNSRWVPPPWRVCDLRADGFRPELDLPFTRDRFETVRDGSRRFTCSSI